MALDQFIGLPTLGFSANSLAPNTTNGVSPAFYLDQGFPQDSIVRPPFINPAFANGTNVLAVPPDGLTLPRFQNWSVTYQRQLAENMMLDVSYIGNRGSRLNHHFQSLGVDANMNDPSVLRHGTNVLQSNINSPVAQAAGFTPPYPGFNGNVAQSLRHYPQYQTIQWRGVPTGQQPVPRDGDRAGAPLLTGPAGAVRVHLLQAAQQRLRERAGRQRHQRRACRIPRTRWNGSSAGTTRRTCSSRASRGRCLAPTGGRPGSPRRCWQAGTSPASCAMKADGRSTSP